MVGRGAGEAGLDVVADVPLRRAGRERLPADGAGRGVEGRGVGGRWGSGQGQGGLAGWGMKQFPRRTVLCAPWRCKDNNVAQMPKEAGDVQKL